MIDQLPRDIPASKPPSASGGSSFSGGSQGSGGYSEVVANLPSPGGDSAKELSRNNVDSKKPPREPAAGNRDGEADSIHAESEGDAELQDKPAADGAVVAAGASGAASDTDTAGRKPVAMPQALTMENPLDVLKNDPEMSTIAEEEMLVDGAVKAAVTQAQLAGGDLPTTDKTELAVLSTLNRPAAVAEAQIVQNSANAADPAAKVGALASLIGSSMAANAEGKMPESSTRLLDKAGVSALSANTSLPVTGTETNDGKMPGLPVDAASKEPAVFKKMEVQKELVGIIKEALETKAMVATKASDPGVELSTVKEFGAVRELSVLSPLSGSDSLADRLSVLRATGGPSAVIEPRHQAAVQSQSLNNLRFMLEQGQRAATIQLHPAELGALKIGIDVQNDQLSVHINAAQAMTREALEMMLPKIRAQLMEQGYSSVDITLGDGGQSEEQSSSQQQAAAEQFTGDSGAERNKARQQQPSAATDLPLRARGVEGGRNLVDLFA